MQSLAIQRDDRPVVAALAPLFALITASTVTSLTYARALYLDHHSHRELPWMFIFAAVFTAACTIGYLPLMKRWELTARFRALLGLSAVSYAGLGLGATWAPTELGTVTFAWTSGMSQLLVLQMWSYSIWLLPIRRARHLFPLLAAAATTGAMLGGAIAALLTPELLLYLAAFFLGLALSIVGWASRRLAEAKLGPSSAPEARPLYSQGSRGGLRGAISTLRRTPLLRQLAWLAVTLQVASLLLDVQMSAAAKSSFDGAALASFFGIYYAVANGLTLVLSLLGAERLARKVGLGWVAALPAWPLLAGAITVVALDMVGVGTELLLWLVVATSLTERVATFGAARQAFGAAMTPVDARESERARFLIDGVLVRGATVIAGGAILLADIDLSSWVVLGPAIGLAAFIALLLVRNVGNAYRQALVAGLNRGQLGTIDAIAVNRWAKREAEQSLRVLLTSDSRAELVEGLRRCRALGIAPPADLLPAMLEPQRSEIPTMTLRTFAQLGKTVAPELLLHNLGKDASTSRLRAALLVASNAANDVVHSEELAQRIGALRNHRDSLVRSLACALHGDPPESYADSFRHVLRSVLSEYMRPTRSTIMDAALTVAALQSDALIAPLCDALHSPALTPAAITTLRRLSPTAVAQEITTRLGHDTRSLTERTRLLHLAEQIGHADAIIPALTQADAALRDRAIETLWRLDRRGLKTAMSREVVATMARREVELLLHCARVDAGFSATAQGDPRMQLVRDQVALRRTSNEQRVFRLLGLMYGRESMERAFTHYRSEYRRSRSNAIELLDATLEQSSLRSLITYIESTEHDRWRAYTRPEASLSAPVSMARGLEAVDPLVGKMYEWARSPANDDRPAPGDRSTDDVGFNRQMDRVLLLSRISLFANTPAEELMVVGEVCKPAAYAAGEVIFRPGDPAANLYLLERGQVEILRDKRRVALFEERQAFGELAIVGDSLRNTTARAITDVDCLVLAREDFGALLDVSPSLAKGAIAVLTERLRQTLERLG